MINETEFIKKLLLTAIDYEYCQLEFYKHNSYLVNSNLLQKLLIHLYEQEKKHLDYLKQLLNVYQKDDNQGSDKTNNDIEFLALLQERQNYRLPKKDIIDFYSLVSYAVTEEKKTIEFYEKLKKHLRDFNIGLDIIDSLILSEREHLLKLSEIIIAIKAEQQKIETYKDIILFDLDGVLISENIEISKTQLRPNTISFIENLKSDFAICIFSKNDYSYIDAVLKFHNIRHLFNFIFDNKYLLDDKKDLRKLLAQINLPDLILKKMVLIDDSFSAAPQENVIRVYSFDGDKKDNLFNQNFKELIVKNSLS